MEKGIKALVFDAYGTLFDVHSVIATCNQHFPEQGPALSKAWRAKQLEYTWLRSLMGRYEDFWQVTEAALVFACKTLNLPCPPATRVELMEAYLHLDLYPEVLQSLKAFSNYPLAILSNGSPRMLQAAVENAGLRGIFSHVLSVDTVKIYKPSPRVYELASQKMGVAASAIGFVSSNSWDVIGAKAAGLWTCWVNRSGAPEDELGLLPDARANTLVDLTGLIKA
ncbi:MAG: haloacid dehalogenase type II [Candidatus Acidiferrales bacterium]